MTRLSPTALLGLLVLCTLGRSLSAQAVHRVGLGQVHATINSAVAAASSGDLVLVDPGTYPPFDINGKGLSVLAASSPFSLQPSATRPVIRIANIAVGQTATVAGWSTAVQFGAAAPLEIRACPGTVRIHQARLDPIADLSAAPMRAVVDIVDGRSVWLADVQVWPAAPRNATTASPVPAHNGLDAGLAAVVAERSIVLLQGCQLRGYDNAGAPAAGRWGGDALRLLGETSAVIHADPGGASNRLQGGAGGRFGGSAVHLIATPPREDVRLCGTTLLAKGSGPLPGGAFAINHDRGVVQSGPVTFERFVPACLFESVGAVSSSMRVATGSSHTFTVSSFFSRPYALYLGPTLLRSVSVPGVQNTALLDYLSPLTFPLRVGVLPNTVRITVPIPNAPVLVGTQFGVQAVLGPPAGYAVPALSLSMGALLVVV